MKVKEKVGHRLHKPAVAGSSPAAAIDDADHESAPSEGVSVCHTDAAVYHGWPEPSASHLKCLAEGPVQYYERFLSGASFPESPAMAYGTLLHLWGEVTEQEFWPRVVRASKQHSTSAGGLNAAGKEWAREQDDDKIVVSQADHDKLWAQTRQILANPASRELLEQSVDREFNVRWALPNGHRMRCRCDGATSEVWYDIKTTREAKPLETFGWACHRFHYQIQAAVYASAAVAIGYEPHSMRFIATSTVPPYICEVVYLPDHVVERAYHKVLALTEELAARKEMDHWLPESYGQVHELRVPNAMLED